MHLGNHAVKATKNQTIKIRLFSFPAMGMDGIKMDDKFPPTPLDKESSFGGSWVDPGNDIKHFICQTLLLSTGLKDYYFPCLHAIHIRHADKKYA